VIAMLANGAPEADARATVLAEAFDGFEAVLGASVWGGRTNFTLVVGVL